MYDEQSGNFVGKTIDSSRQNAKVSVNFTVLIWQKNTTLRIRSVKNVRAETFCAGKMPFAFSRVCSLHGNADENMRTKVVSVPRAACGGTVAKLLDV